MNTTVEYVSNICIGLSHHICPLAFPVLVCNGSEWLFRNVGFFSVLWSLAFLIACFGPSSLVYIGPGFLRVRGTRWQMDWKKQLDALRDVSASAVFMMVLWKSLVMVFPWLMNSIQVAAFLLIFSLCWFSFFLLACWRDNDSVRNFRLTTWLHYTTSTPRSRRSRTPQPRKEH